MAKPPSTFVRGMKGRIFTIGENMGTLLGPAPENVKAIEEFERLCKEKECFKLKSFLYRICGKRQIHQYEQWQAIYYEWRGQKLLVDLKFTGFAAQQGLASDCDPSHF